MRKLKIFLLVVTFLLTAFIIPMAIGLFVPYSLPAAIVLAALGAVLFLGCIAYNLKVYSRYKKKLISASVNEIYSYLENRKAAITQDAEEARRAVEKEMKQARFYNVLLVLAQVLLSTGVCIFLNHLILTTGEDGDLGTSAVGQFVVCTVIYLFLGLNPLAALLYIGKPNHRIDYRKDVLQAKDYPELNRLTQNAANAVGYKGKVILVRDLDGEGFAVCENENSVSVSIPPVILSLLTEAEVYDIFLHELSHAANRDTLLKKRYNVEKERYGAESAAILKFMKSLFFKGIENLVNEKIEMYDQFATILKESKADEAVKLYGDPQAYIDATAKAYLYDECFRFPIRELSYEIYANETAPRDYYERERNVFEREYRGVLAEKKEILLRTLPAKSATHPTLAMRMQAMGVTDFNADRREKESALKEELEKYIKACSEVRASWEGWDECRKDYEKRKTRMEEFERMVSAGEEPDEMQYMEALNDYYMTDRVKAANLAEQMLQKENCPFAEMVSGIILCWQDDTQGIELLFHAAEQSYFVFNNVGDIIGDTALRTGDEEFMAQTRKRTAEVTQKQLDFFRAQLKAQKLRPSSFAPCDLSEETLAGLRKIAARLFGTTQNRNLEIYAAKRKKGFGKNTYYISIDFPLPRAPQETEQFCSDFAYYLDKKENSNEVYFILYKHRLHGSVKKAGTRLYP